MTIDTNSYEGSQTYEWMKKIYILSHSKKELELVISKNLNNRLLIVKSVGSEEVYQHTNSKECKFDLISHEAVV